MMLYVAANAKPPNKRRNPMPNARPMHATRATSLVWLVPNPT